MIKCPDETTNLHRAKFSWPWVFMAGGITNCPDWQSELYENLKDLECVFFNPRRDDFDLTDSSMSEKQIEWEYRHLGLCDNVLFWFPKESVCPITLYELGVQLGLNYVQRAYGRTSNKIFVGCDPKYTRKFDLEKQISLMDNNIELVYSLDDLVIQIKEHVNV